jgi:phosphoglycerate dehydrogenase-like enzyme
MPMKAVVFESRVRPDVRAAFEHFPDVAPVFVPSGDEQALARELPGAELFVVSNRVYSEGVGRILREQGTAVKWVQFTTAGFDNAIKAGLPPGLVITNCGGVRSASVAEQALTLLLALVRQVRTIEAACREHRWIRDSIAPSLHNLNGRRMLVVGMGPVGQAIGRRALAFDMTIAAVSRATEPAPPFTTVYPRARFVEACRSADVVVLATALDDELKAIINRESLAALPKDAYVINIARGAMVDEVALIEALRSGHLGGAGLDVTAVEPTPADSPLWDLPNVVLSPHMGGAGDPSEVGVGAVLTQNLTTYLAGKPFPRATRT